MFLMRRFLILILFLFPVSLDAQVLNANQHKALNSYVEFANHAVDHVESNLLTLKGIYEDCRYFKTKKFDNVRTQARFVDPEIYYFDNANNLGKTLGVDGENISRDAAALNNVLSNINVKCRALEVYLRLGDYKKDSLAYGDKLIDEIKGLYLDFRARKEVLEKSIYKSYRKLQPLQEGNAYHKAEKEMWSILNRETRLLKEWNYNFNEEKKANWPAEMIQQNISENEAAEKKFTTAPSSIKYPESSSYTSFARAIESSLSSKRDKIDNYNSEAKKTGRHGNESYLTLINHFNNDLIPSYNDFVNYSSGNGQRLLSYIKFSPVFDIIEVEEKANYSAAPFKDIPVGSFNINKKNQSIQPSTSNALNNYVDFINESLRQVKYLMLMIRNYNSSANYYKTSTSPNKGTITYNHENFKIPQTAYHKAINESNSLPGEYVVPLNTQHEVLMNILKEIDALGVELDEYTHSKKYLADDFKRSDEILKRTRELFILIDGKKEHLYSNVHDIFYSYVPDSPNSNWQKSTGALTNAIDLGKKNLYESKDFLAGKKNSLPDVESLKSQSRTLIVEEYSNLQGIKRLGRSNGLCPYTPYENIAENSGALAEKISTLTPGLAKDNERAYENLLYTYNTLVDDFNKFTDLAPIENLRNIHQINVLEFPNVEVTAPLVAKNDKPKKDDKDLIKPAAKQEKSSPEIVVKRDTVTVVKEIKTEVVKRDTVFVEKSKVDTVYITNNEVEDDFLSLEGYAHNNIVLLLDVSSSMDSPDKLPLLKRSVKQLVQLYRPEDEISIVLYSGKASVALEPTSGSEKEKIQQVINGLKSEGASDANAGLRLAYKVADGNYKRGGNNRVILATDGEFKISGSSLRLVEESSKQDIYLSVFNYTAKKEIIKNLKELSEKGKGNYENITPSNADVKMVKEAKAKRAIN
jgi:Ca-activated chloride channel homolog